MKKFLCTAALACLICTAGCGQKQSNMIADLPPNLSEEVSEIAVFVSGMGCSDPNCTDASHHHDCPPDCNDYEHHHNCALDCADESHHHNGANSANGSGQHHTKQHHGNDHH